jgi:hypothetical protein
MERTEEGGLVSVAGRPINSIVRSPSPVKSYLLTIAFVAIASKLALAVPQADTEDCGWLVASGQGLVA